MLIYAYRYKDFIPDPSTSYRNFHENSIPATMMPRGFPAWTTRLRVQRPSQVGCCQSDQGLKVQGMGMQSLSGSCVEDGRKGD